MHAGFLQSVQKWIIPARAGWLLVIVCFATHGITVFNNYALDDNFAVTANELVQKGIRGIPDILTSPAYVLGSQKAGYHPVSAVLQALEFELFGLNPHISHLVNVLLFAGLVVLIFHVLRRVFRLDAIHPLLPFGIALMYAVHPAFTEVVASIKNRSEILSFLFALLAVQSAARFFESPSWLKAAGVILLMELSLLSKMVTPSYAVIIILLGAWQGAYRRKAFYALGGVLLVTTLAHVMAVLSSLQRPYLFVENPLAEPQPFSLHLGLIGKTLFFYLKFFLIPFPFRFYYGYNMIPLEPFWHPLPLFSLLLHGALLVAAIRWFLGKQMIGFFILAYLINIFPFSNVVLYTGIVAERVLFIPGLWYLCALALGVYTATRAPKYRRIPSGLRKVVLYAACLVLLIWIALSMYRNTRWKDSFTLAATDIRYLKNSAFANSYYGRQLMLKAETSSDPLRKHYTELAKKHFKRACEIYDYFEPHFRLGMIYEYEDQNRDSALYYFQNAYRLNPNSPRARFQLAKQLFLRGNNAEAAQLWEALYRELPQDTLTLFFYAQALYNLGRKEESAHMNADLLRLAPQTYYPYYNYGMVAHMQRDTLAAMEHLEKAVRYGYRGQDVYHILAGMYAMRGLSDRMRWLQERYDSSQ
ncbi:MAG: hypothetical protein KatS3mg031_2626 [Chitinophagales bacterium]|nr:MAG: hypothetical protein KatS3mg031_2626 [Chitinophagales bacterium]